jgi:hypothetical protein
MTEPHTDNRCVNAEDANWAAPFLFGRWAAYNAGYGEWGLASNDYRSQGIASYQFMIANGQNGPYSWWESQQFPNPGSPFPTTDGRHIGLTVKGSGTSVTLTLTGDQASGPVLFQLPAFVNNIAHASTGTVDQKTGTVTLSASARSVAVQLKQAA